MIEGNVNKKGMTKEKAKSERWPADSEPRNYIEDEKTEASTESRI